MSITFSLTGTGSYLRSFFRPSLDLVGNYGLGLVGFYSYNALQNIYEGNNKVYYSDPGTASKTLTIPNGAYEINSLNDYIKEHLEGKKDDRKERDELNKAFSLVANTNTLQCVIESKYDIDFTPSDSIGRMLGFSSKKLEANIVHKSDLDVRISPATNIRVQCNITGGSYLNGASDHTIFEFALDAEPGELVAKEPSSVLYLPVSTHRIEDIALWLSNQDGEPINFGKEQVSIRLELKKWA